MKRYPRPFVGLAFFPLLFCTLGCPRAGSPDRRDDFGTVSKFALVNQDGKKVTREDFKGKVWRIGAMGVNARKDAVLMTFAALETVLRHEGFGFTPGAGVDAALAVYHGPPG